ncbi:MAG: sensor histidine kinase [Terriglobia bacterium]
MITATDSDRSNDYVTVLQNTRRDLSEPDAQFVAVRIAGLISHELRLPLTAILAYAELLTEDGVNETQRADLCQEISLAASQMNDLIHSLMEFSKGRESLQPTAGDVVNTVRRAIRMVTVRPEFRHVRVTYSHEGFTEGWFDSNRLKQAVANLVLNACEAVSPHSGTVEVATVGKRNSLEIDVCDNGPGVPEPIRDSIFQPFVSYGKEGGSGLGLAVVRRIIEDHGGEVYLARADEDGTLFKIVLPSVVSEEAQPTAEAVGRHDSISLVPSTTGTRVGARKRVPMRKSRRAAASGLLLARLAVPVDSSTHGGVAKIRA